MRPCHRIALYPSRGIRTVGLFAAVAVTVAACSSSATSSNATKPPSGSTAATSSGTVSVTANQTLGQILVGGTGRTLYLFEKDTGGKSACTGACATAWPPLTTTGTPQAGSGVSAAMLATITRPDGTTQVTYNGHPLYYFSHDMAPGQTTGEGLNRFGGLWYAVSAQGTAVTRPQSPVGTSSGTHSSSQGY